MTRNNKVQCSENSGGRLSYRAEIIDKVNRFISHVSRKFLRSIHPPIQSILMVLSYEVKWPKHVTNY
jgi:hypothetical protein